jgi:hypothetical protein
MPSVTNLARAVRLATLPEMRGLILAAAHSDALRDVARRAANDRTGLVRDLRNPANARELVRGAVRHPAARELVSASLLFLPGRYLPLGWAASWATHRVFGRYLDPPVKGLDGSVVEASRRLKNVTPEAR